MVGQAMIKNQIFVMATTGNIWKRLITEITVRSNMPVNIQYGDMLNIDIALKNSRELLQELNEKISVCISADDVNGLDFLKLESNRVRNIIDILKRSKQKGMTTLFIFYGQEAEKLYKDLGNRTIEDGNFVFFME